MSNFLEPHALANRAIERSKMKSDILEAWDFILPLSREYPTIESWFHTKVVPGLLEGSRHLIRIERDGKIAGLGIAKHTPDEKKICTVRVAPEFEGRGIGLRVFDGLLKWLDTDQPHLTVSEEKIQVFERIFDWYGFKMTSANNGLYIPNRVEFAYNELEPSKEILSSLKDGTRGLTTSL